MKNVFFLLLFLFICSLLQAQQFEEKEFLYRVTKIKTKGDYYVVYAERNDSIFKILSKKKFVGTTNFKLIEKGKYYSFDFDNSDNTSENKKVKVLAGIITSLEMKDEGYFCDGDTRIKFTKRTHYMMYFTKNLIGLYYAPSLSKPAP